MLFGDKLKKSVNKKVSWREEILHKKMQQVFVSLRW